MSAESAAPGPQLAQLGPYGLVRRPVVPAQALTRLGNGEHVLIVSRPRHRLVTLGLTVRARIPRQPTRSAPAPRADTRALDTSPGVVQKGRAT